MYNHLDKSFDYNYVFSPVIVKIFIKMSLICKIINKKGLDLIEIKKIILKFYWK